LRGPFACKNTFFSILRLNNPDNLKKHMPRQSIYSCQISQNHGFSLFRASAILFALWMLAACTTPPEPPPPDIKALLFEMKEHMYLYISEERQKLNTDAMPLRRDPLLGAATQAHSEAMAERKAFDEGGSDENIAIQRLAANPNFQGFVGENSAMQYFYPEHGFDPETFAQSLVDQWLQSEGHRANIEYTNFALTGIGVAANGNEIYAAGLFATETEGAQAAD
jgi:uncharacterized protein YkwD